MDVTAPGGLSLYLFGLLLGLVCWVVNRELNRINNKTEMLDKRTINHAQRLTALDGKTDDT